VAKTPRRRITVVNDSPEFLELMQAILDGGSGYQVTTIDGDALTSLAPIRDSRPHLLIIDLVMHPDGLSGWDVLTAARRDAELSKVPIIICTGDVYTVRRRAAELADAPGVTLLEKPFNIDALEAMVSRALDYTAAPDPLTLPPSALTAAPSAEAAAH
jgi:CheY-like chemotaxis protein